MCPTCIDEVCQCRVSSAESNVPKSLDGKSSPSSAPDISLIDAMIRMEMSMSHLCEKIEALVDVHAQMLDQLVDMSGGFEEEAEPTHYLSGKPIK